jgi:hypothetical protein
MVVVEENEYENALTCMNSSRIEQKGWGFKLCLDLSIAYWTTISYPGSFSHSPLEAGHDFGSRSSSKLCQKRDMKRPRDPCSRGFACWFRSGFEADSLDLPRCLAQHLYGLNPKIVNRKELLPV